MGAVVSLENEEVKQNDLLKRLAGKEAISDNDPYWNKLFSFNFNIPQWSRSAQKKFVDSAGELLQSLLYNSPTSNNFAVLIKVFLRRCGELESSAKCENKIFLWQTANSLIIIRYICAFFAERLSSSEFVKIFEDRSAPSSLDDDESPASLADELREFAFRNSDGTQIAAAEKFLQALVDILCDVPVNTMTLSIHQETIRVILALLSTQLYAEDVAQTAPFLQYLMRNRERATDLVRVLLENFLHQTTELEDETRRPKTESLVISLASSMWSAFQKSVMILPEDVDPSSANAVDGDIDGAGDTFPAQNLSALSAALLLSVVCYPAGNPYKEVLALFQNAQEVSSLANLAASFKLDFTALYNRLCACVDAGDRLATLLLYMLLHNNCGFRNFVLSRINLENLVIPCIKALNSGISPQNAANAAAFRAASHQTYLALIVMLILSEDDFFCKIIHETKLHNVTWYQADRPITEISLGGLIVLVFVKIIHINTVKTRDRYLHTNTMAALANMSAYFKHLSPLVCQKLLGLLETMTKRQAKLIRQIVEYAESADEKNGDGGEIPHDAAHQENNTTGEHPSDNSAPIVQKDDASTQPTTPREEDSVSREYKESLNQDVSVLEEGIRNILEILNACLANNLRSNTDLIYGILYKRELFELYRNHPFYEDLVWNIYAVINHFAGKIEAHCTENSSISPPPTPTAKAATGPIVSVSGVMETIKKAAIEWPTDRLHKFPELKFKYIEDENTVDFFVPYIWRLVNATAAIHFNSASIRLHNVILNGVGNSDDESVVDS